MLTNDHSLTLHRGEEYQHILSCFMNMSIRSLLMAPLYFRREIDLTTRLVFPWG